MLFCKGLTMEFGGDGACAGDWASSWSSSGGAGVVEKGSMGNFW